MARVSLLASSAGCKRARKTRPNEPSTTPCIAASNLLNTPIAALSSYIQCARSLACVGLTLALCPHHHRCHGCGRQSLACRRHVACDLDLEFVHTTKAPLLTQAGNQIHAQCQPIEV